MRSRSSIAAVLALFFLGTPGVQGQVALGPELSVAEDVDFGVGAVVEVPLTSVYPDLEFAGRFTFYFPDSGDYWEINADARYLFPLEGESPVLPFVLAGIAIGHFSWEYDLPVVGTQSGSDTELGLRLGGGFKVPLEQAVPFAELGLGVGDIPDFSLRAGVTFLIG
jgi:opacity protein-like surface antigen